MTDLPLCSPPSYEYESTAPYWVCHFVEGERARTWTMWTLESALLRYWLAAEVPPRRVMIDAMGVTVLGTAFIDDMPRMCGTRQTMDGTLALVRKSNLMLESEAELLKMVEIVRSLDGQAL